ncbi:Grx4 family monothiol glutaredoxin [Gammaproteobacteria bacterium]|nr:Grx4 family monothiol glutaredoxin [Gammaproteobacteria bacterium]
MEEINLEQLTKQSEIVLFMKGDVAQPQCGFSAHAVKILQALGKSFTTVDVLSNPSIRQGMKDYSDWPTFPQLYIQGEFMGGVDIMHEMYHSGELSEALSD